jgi:hypothetical protein
VVAAVVMGVQVPRVMSVPDCVASRGREAIELAASAGLELDPWQQLVLERSLGVRADGKWAAFEVGVNVPRQNGKGGILEARELAGLFVLGSRMVIHSAHQFDTSLEAFRRLLWLIEDTPDLDREVRRVSRSHGEEGIELKSGQRIRFRTRTKGGGRGFSCDDLILDEAMFLSLHAHGALLPTLSARPNSQVWYTGSAVDQFVHEDGVVFARVRKRGLTGDPSLAYFEWSVDEKNPEEVEPATAVSLEAWRQANPGLGIRISAEHVEHEQRSMDGRTFAVERLGVGDWPRTDGAVGALNADEWVRLTDPDSTLDDPICIAFDVTPDRSRACIAAAGRRRDGLFHVEVVEHRRGTGWVAPRLRELIDRHEPAEVVCDGPARSLLQQLEAEQIDVTETTATEYAQACGLLVDHVDQHTIRHLGTPELAAAVRGVSTRPLGDAWAWSRRSSAVDVSPLVAVTLALWAAGRDHTSVYSTRGVAVV